MNDGSLNLKTRLFFSKKKYFKCMWIILITLLCLLFFHGIYEYLKFYYTTPKIEEIEKES